MAAILFLPFGRCSQLPYSVAIKTCSLHQPPTNPALPGFILIGIKIVNSFRNYLKKQSKYPKNIEQSRKLNIKLSRGGLCSGNKQGGG